MRSCTPWCTEFTRSNRCRLGLTK